jgi:hypothetical protein
MCPEFMEGICTVAGLQPELLAFADRRVCLAATRWRLCRFVEDDRGDGGDSGGLIMEGLVAAAST